MKNKHILISLALICAALIPLRFVVAQGIVPCGRLSQDPCTLCHLIVGIYNLITWGRNILLTISVVCIFISGIMYIISAGTGLMEQAKKFLSASLIGFTLVITAWLIVATTMWILSAKTDLGIGKTDSNWFSSGTITFECVTKSSVGQTTGQGGGTSSAPEKPTYSGDTSLLTDADARAKLSAAGISVSSTGGCSDQNNSRCTSLEGIPASTIENVIAIKSGCGKSVTVTGGTETGHQSHGYGKSPLDLKWDTSLAACIKENSSKYNVSKICTTSADAAYRINCDYDEGVEHIHIAF